MQRFTKFTLLLLLFQAAIHTWASPLTLQSAADDAGKALLKLFTYDAGGKLLHTGTAFFVSAQAEGVTTYTLMQGAARAEVIDAKGKKYAVSRILGANSTTDLVKFSVEGVKKCSFMQPAGTPASKGSHLFMLPAGATKKSQPVVVSVTDTEAYNQWLYYQTSAENKDYVFGLPLFNENGEVAAILQRNVKQGATTACAIDARFINDLNISATSPLQSDLRALLIPKALPDNVHDALTYLYMLPQNDSLWAQTAYNDFVATYPQMPDGYLSRATFAAGKGLYADSEADLNKALQLAVASTDSTYMTADAVHYHISNLLYRTLTSRSDTVAVHPNWTLQRAEQEAAQAYALKPNALYLMQQGYCCFSAKQYAEAYNHFEQASRDANFASSETYFATARALELSGGDSLQVMVLLDSCIARLPQPVSARNAQYYIERAARLLHAKRFRAAVDDYNEYEKAVGPRNLSDNFYYLRSQAELEAHMYQQALDDMRTAIATAAMPLPYRLEEAYILLRVGEFEEAIDAATRLLADLPENPDCYRIIGVAHGELGHKKLAVENLTKAQQLGDDVAASFLPKYQ